MGPKLLAFALLTASAAHAAPAAAPAPTIVCFGDSLTAGTGANAGESYPDFLRKDLAAAGYRTIVVNEGVNGIVTGDALPRVAQVLAGHPDVVVVELGANDAIYGKPTAETERNLRLIIEQLQAAHTKVVLAGLDMRPLLPMLPPTMHSPSFSGLFPLHGQLASTYKIPDIPFFLEGVYGVPGLMSSDYIHPNGQGYEKVAQTVLPYVEAALGKPAAK